MTSGGHGAKPEGIINYSKYPIPAAHTLRRQRQRDAPVEAYLASLTGLDMVHVPLKSTAEAINE